ncbi:hypothetical protein WH8501_08475 [Crocosphaera watsonii WH 8501]|uniref:Uncharacterized protein n=6 Tax=Crocosphaera watsonii TaxID=263511 RepID=Q4BVP3_CROWT|nr:MULTISPECIES: hypothetical protein [Crocosphaera]EAM47976.1 hypothetical protein CwatDRAFT_0624 [Crocosphaera watsonii WH 8501]EHJ09840.1 hypothetical protein CWATWH0003_5394 [Crocosphaera watsonii WH 0003]MCH2247378.1 hypothetical protein [Crocosphaera sp.]CCQ52264.1 FIG00566412: hypothetical protein [Crocosphaera watsonii WH 8502]CCQ58316.1 hypothetical protein CWATWH0005_3034 [Crocosphaera watsonii WH 0005]
MVAVPPSPDDIRNALETPVDFNFELPDPEDEEIEEFDFQEKLDSVWKICDRFDLQTDIWRGRILRAIRDREKKGGEGRGTGFLNWLKKREITKSQAYALIQLANSADTLLAEGVLDPETINNFSKRAFVETAKSDPEVQKLVSEAAQKGDRITRREVKQLSDEWTAMSSDLLPSEVKEKAEEGTLPPRHLAPLVREMEKLPDLHLETIQKEVAENPDIDTVKLLTTDAKNLAKYLDAAAQVQTLKKTPLDLEMALDEAVRLECLNTAADLVKQATQIEQIVGKLYTTWKRLGSLSDRLYVDTGASNPHLRSMLTSLESLSGEVIEVQLDEAGEKTVRLRMMTDSMD